MFKSFLYSLFFLTSCLCCKSQDSLGFKFIDAILSQKIKTWSIVHYENGVKEVYKFSKSDSILVQTQWFEKNREATFHFYKGELIRIFLFFQMKPFTAGSYEYWNGELIYKKERNYTEPHEQQFYLEALDVKKKANILLKERLEEK